MSDNPGGWAELLATPLGPDPADDTPLAALPCAHPLIPGDALRPEPTWLPPREW